MDTPLERAMMREISPAVGMSVDEFLDRFGSVARPQVEEIRRQKALGTRPSPSTSLIDTSSLMTPPHRAMLLNKIAALVDENYCGRAEMCFQFANLLDRALTFLGFPSRGVIGTAIYFDQQSNEIHRWRHAWVRVGDEVIDGNVDCTRENPMVNPAVSVPPYWGSVSLIPKDRRLRQNTDDVIPFDEDVENVWWPDLKKWLETDFVRTS